RRTNPAIHNARVPRTTSPSRVARKERFRSAGVLPLQPGTEPGVERSELRRSAVLGMLAVRWGQALGHHGLGRQRPLQGGKLPGPLDAFRAVAATNLSRGCEAVVSTFMARQPFLSATLEWLSLSTRIVLVPPSVALPGPSGLAVFES